MYCLSNPKTKPRFLTQPIFLNPLHISSVLISSPQSHLLPGKECRTQTLSGDLSSPPLCCSPLLPPQAAAWLPPAPYASAPSGTDRAGAERQERAERSHRAGPRGHRAGTAPAQREQSPSTAEGAAGTRHLQCHCQQQGQDRTGTGTGTGQGLGATGERQSR